jgi:hypothetical protein
MDRRSFIWLIGKEGVNFAIVIKFSQNQFSESCDERTGAVPIIGKLAV